MCGIAGFVGAGNDNHLRTMTETLVHRGPDEYGYYRDQHVPVFFGHRRLIVLDPAGGAQPMWDTNGTIGVIFNGEIYNHRELRTELETLGCHFISDHADTEVLVHGWKVWGQGLFLRLDGMFALAILDRRDSSVILARDRFGEKPLYYAEKPDAVVFGSEITAVLAHPSQHNVSISKIALQKFFAHGFFPAPHTPYQGVHKLPPGHTLSINTTTLETKRTAYWRFALGDKDPPAGTEKDWAVTLDCLIRDAASSRLEADVPLGFFLSGGVDSSSILSFASDTRDPASLNTFSMGFRETSFDESQWAQEMALYAGSTHHTEVCDLEAAQSTLPTILSKLDEPIGDPSILPTSLLCSFARKHVTVALSGDGGDELFAGYDPFLILNKAQLYDRFVPGPVHNAIRSIAGTLPRSDTNMSFDFILNRGLRGLKHPESEWNARWLGPLEPMDIAELFQEPVDAESLYSEAILAWESCPSEHIVDKTLDFYTRFYLPDSILTKTDRASMAVSLEVRSPFLANSLTDFAQRLPWHTKLRNQTGKWILKQALEGRLPPKIISRKKKGFGIPLSRWLRSMNPPQKTIPSINTTWLEDRWGLHTAKQKTRGGNDSAALWCWMALSQGLKL